MIELQAWFAPLLWVLGTLTSVIAFVRLCKPVWNIFQAPKELCKTMSALQDTMNSHFEATNARLDRFDEDLKELKEHAEKSDKVDVNLLRDRIVSGFYQYNAIGHLPNDVYRTLCEMYTAYKENGGNSYVDSIMEELHELYKRSVQNNLQNK